MKKLLLTICLVLFIVSGIAALELSGGKIKVKLYDESGRFSLYFLDTLSGSTYVPLFFDKDPKTTALFVNTGNRVYTMGDSSFFKQDLQSINATTASFLWTSKILDVTETFTLVKSLKNAFFDGVKITITLNNKSETKLNTGVSYLLDTYLGEKDKTHFITANGMDIQAETYYTSDLPAYFVSPLKKNKSFKGLQCMLEGPGITIPDKVIFANWKRLKENTFSYRVQDSRNFNFLPYSINDSAAALYYNQEILPPGGQRKIVIVMGAATGSLFQGTTAQAETAEMNKLYLQTAQTGGEPTNTEASVKTDLLAVNNLLKKINSLLESPGLEQKGDLDLMKNIIGNLKQRKKLYENR